MNNDIPAFPHEYKYGDGTAHRDLGMTLRDYFAAKAMQGFCATWPEESNWPTDAAELAKSAYIVADCMMKARNS